MEKFLLTFCCLIAVLSCEFQKDDSALMPEQAEENLVNPDSIVVRQLIQQSREVFAASQSNAKAFDDYLQEAEQLALQNNYHRFLFEIYNLIGQRLRNQSFYPQAMDYHRKALDIADNLNDVCLLSEVHNQIGVVYRRIDENSKALDMHMKALQYAEECGEDFNISVALNGIGNVSLNLQRYRSAIEYFRKANVISKRGGNVMGMAINVNNIGEAFLNLNEPDSALHYFFKSLDYNLSIGSRIGQSICFNSIGDAYASKHQNRLALDYLMKALEINLEEGDRMYIAVSYMHIGETYLNDNHLSEAINYLLLGLDVANEIGSKFVIEKASKLLAEAYERKGNASMALKFFKQGAAYKDSLINEKNIFHLSTMEAVYDQQAQQNQIEQLSREALVQNARLTRQKVWLWSAFLILLVVVVITALMIYQGRLKHKNRALLFQQRLLRSQMNPHFIFNALSAIQVFILENDMEKSSRFLSDFAKLMRHVLKSSNYEYISLKDELEMLHYYMNLQKLRFITPFEYKIEVDSELDKSEVLVLPMLVQPFVENAIEHGLKPLGGGGLISIRFKKREESIFIEVDDNGIGIDYSDRIGNLADKHESLALKITKERLDVLEKDSRKKAVFEIFDKKNVDPFDRGTLVRFKLPIIYYNRNPKIVQGDD